MVREQFARKQMPRMLKLLTVFCFAGVLFAVGAATPGGNFTINGRAVTYSEFWRSGAGPLFVLIGVILPITGYAFVKRKSWGRFLFAGLLVAINIATMVMDEFMTAELVSPSDFVWSLASMALLVWYLFFKQSVKDYFTKRDRTSKNSVTRP